MPFVLAAFLITALFGATGYLIGLGEDLSQPDSIIKGIKYATNAIVAVLIFSLFYKRESTEVESKE